MIFTKKSSCRNSVTNFIELFWAFLKIKLADGRTGVWIDRQSFIILSFNSLLIKSISELTFFWALHTYLRSWVQCQQRWSRHRLQWLHWLQQQRYRGRQVSPDHTHYTPQRRVRHLAWSGLNTRKRTQHISFTFYQCNNNNNNNNTCTKQPYWALHIYSGKY